MKNSIDRYKQELVEYAGLIGEIALDRTNLLEKVIVLKGAFFGKSQYYKNDKSKLGKKFHRMYLLAYFSTISMMEMKSIQAKSEIEASIKIFKELVEDKKLK